jgi:hypothetical protein
MGHGSAGNVNPIHSLGGHYPGVVVFSMTGDWEITFNFNNGEVELGSLVWDLVF